MLYLCCTHEKKKASRFLVKPILIELPLLGSNQGPSD